MSVGREFAASIVLNDKILWVTGGSNGGILASTEYVTVTGTIPGPNLPMGLMIHAMVAINSTCSMVIGGAGQELWMGEIWHMFPLTYFYDHNEGEWINGSSLMQARYAHAAGIITDEVTGEHFVSVTGGVVTSGRVLNSTEILQDEEWVQGKINDMLLCGYF